MTIMCIYDMDYDMDSVFLYYFKCPDDKKDADVWKEMCILPPIKSK